MSLFGNNTSATPQSGGIFNLGNPEPPGKRKSIFEPPTIQTSMSPGTTSSNTVPPSLFGKPATTSASLAPFSFGNTAPTTSGSASLFGSAPAQQSSGTSFFGAPSNQQPTSSTSFLGNPTPNAQSSAAFPAATTNATSQTQLRDPAYFSSLLERQKKKARLLPGDNNGRLSNLSGLDMDLGDLARKAQELGGRSERLGNGTDSRAHYLLAGSGVSPGKAYRDFQALDSDPVIRATGRDLSDETSTYTKDLRSKGREVMMRESMERVYREVDSYIEQTLGIDFEEQQQRIMQHFGLATGDSAIPQESSLGNTFGNLSRKRGFAKAASTTTRSVFGKSGMEKSIIGTPGSVSGTVSFFSGDKTSAISGSLLKGQTSRDLRDKERMFVEKLELLNRSRSEEKPFAVMQQFGQVEEQAAGENPRQLVDAYHALREITKESHKPAAGAAGVKERQYAQAYLDERSDSAKATTLRRQILEGSRTYLERSFYQEIESLIERNPREAQLGGRPTVINKIRAYIRVRTARKDLAPDGAELQQIGENGDYCWILIFYLLRSGHVKEAAEYVNNDAAFQSTDRRFVSYLTAYSNHADRRLSRKLQEMIEGEYQQRAKIAPKNTIDPYRLACYKVIGRCDLASRNLDIIGQGIEDWIWLQFNLARDIDRDEELAGDVFGLEQICETFVEIGQKHFQKGQVDGSRAYGMYFLMQILAGMFEQAVEYLHTFNPVSAVHFSIALAYYGLLRVSDFSVAGHELLTFSTTQQPLLNFVPLIAQYTTTFRTALPVSAVDYLVLICLNSDLTPPSLGASQTNACHECLRELCLETREFAKLLGDIRTDGTRLPGAIEQRAKLIQLNTHEEFLRSITNQAAAIADQRGQIADAVLLYHLCEDYDNVVSVLNRSLADAVTLDLGESPLQLQPLKPRRQDGQKPAAGSQQDGSVSSLSLTQATSSPVELAKSMISLYNNNAAYYNQISATNRDTCGALLRLLSIRAHLEANPPRFMAALEELNDLNILPLHANGSIPLIRNAATAFGALPQVLARCAGISIVWAVRAIGGERDNVAQHGGWETGVGGDRDEIKAQLYNMAKDLMVFAGLVRYKLPSRVYDMLTRAGGDVGGY